MQKLGHLRLLKEKKFYPKKSQVYVPLAPSHSILDQKETQTQVLYFINHLILFNFMASLMWSSLHNPNYFTHFSVWSPTPAWSIFILLPWSVCAKWWFTNWKLEVIRPLIANEAFAVFPLWKFRVEPPPNLIRLKFQTMLLPTPHAFRIPRYPL